MIKVGLLYDSISDNIGDKAIGISLQQFCESNSFEWEVVNPFNYQTDRYSTLIIGGGAIVRNKGDFYYDNFRITGEHILNTVGIDASNNLDYLKNYVYVSVRSKNDQKKLTKYDVKSHVVPCTTLALKKPPQKTQNQNCAGIHLAATTLLTCPGIEQVIQGMQQPKKYISFTRYNKDKSLMQKVFNPKQKDIIDHPEPEQMLAEISGLKSLITSSLHATIFAYISGVPFLSFDQPKVRDFLTERGLSHLVFSSAQELKEKLKMLDYWDVDLKSRYENDITVLEKHFEHLRSIIINQGNGASKLNTGSAKKSITAAQEKIEKKQLNDVIEERDLLIASKNHTINIEAQKATRLAQRNKINEKNLTRITKELDQIYNSRLWKAIKYTKKAKEVIRRKLTRFFGSDGEI